MFFSKQDEGDANMVCFKRSNIDYKMITLFFYKYFPSWSHVSCDSKEKDVDSWLINENIERIKQRKKVFLRNFASKAIIKINLKEKNKIEEINIFCYDKKHVSWIEEDQTIEIKNIKRIELERFALKIITKLVFIEGFLQEFVIRYFSNEEIAWINEFEENEIIKKISENNITCGETKTIVYSKKNVQFIKKKDKTERFLKRKEECIGFYNIVKEYDEGENKEIVLMVAMDYEQILKEVRTKLKLMFDTIKEIDEEVYLSFFKEVREVRDMFLNNKEKYYDFNNKRIFLFNTQIKKTVKRAFENSFSGLRLNDSILDDVFYKSTFSDFFYFKKYEEKIDKHISFDYVFKETYSRQSLFKEVFNKAVLRIKSGTEKHGKTFKFGDFFDDIKKTKYFLSNKMSSYIIKIEKENKSTFLKVHLVDYGSYAIKYLNKVKDRVFEKVTVECDSEKQVFWIEKERKIEINNTKRIELRDFAGKIILLLDKVSDKFFSSLTVFSSNSQFSWIDNLNENSFIKGIIGKHFLEEKTQVLCNISKRKECVFEWKLPLTENQITSFPIEHKNLTNNQVKSISISQLSFVLSLEEKYKKLFFTEEQEVFLKTVFKDKF